MTLASLLGTAAYRTSGRLVLNCDLLRSLNSCSLLVSCSTMLLLLKSGTGGSSKSSEILPVKLGMALPLTYSNALTDPDLYEKLSADQDNAGRLARAR